MEEVLPDGPGAALGRRVPAQVRQLLVDPLQGHLGSHSSEKAKIQTECRETGLVLKERPAFIYIMYNRVNHGGVQNAIRKITPSYLALYNP